MQNEFYSLQVYKTHELISESSRFLDEFESSVSKAIDEANSLILKQLLENISDNSKMNKVYEDVNLIKPTFENILNFLHLTLGDQSSLTNLSDDFLEIFFDLNKNTYSKKIADETFIKQSSSDAIIKMCSIMILCHIAKFNLKKEQLQKHFSEKPVFVDENVVEIKTISEPIVAKTNIDNKKTIKKVATKPEIKAKPQEEQTAKQETFTKKPTFKLYVFVGVALIAIIGLFFVLNSNETASEPNEDVVKVSDSETIPQTIEPADVTKLGDFIDFTLPSDDIITIPEKGTEKAILDLILDKSKSLDEQSWWIVLDRVHFEKRETTYLLDSEEQIKNLSLILTSFPKTEIRIAGYTDNQGNPESNKQLCEQRTIAIKNALVVLGIDEKRVTTEGFGQEFSISENNSEIGRKTNRRIAIKLMKK